MKWLRNGGYFISAALFLTTSSFTFAQESKTPQINTNKLNIPHTNGSINVDADLSDKAWQDALVVDLNIVNSPWNNRPSPVKTTAKIMENGEYLYISFLAEDPDPSKIKGFLSDRDSTLTDDIVGIKLDTYNNRRILYQFLVNPYGVQNDAIANENTGSVNTLWDGIWQSYGKITDQGYQVEIAIPFNILNFEPSDANKTWSLELLRLYPRDERLRISHMPLNRDNNCWACQMPEAVGFKQAKLGKNIQLTPYAAASYDQSRDIWDATDPWHNKTNSDAGIDLRWGITPSNSLTATLNPDFSNVESDSGQLSVNKNFSLFFKEKRSFFLENSDYFSSNNNLVYTRNIADPDYGVKFTGREQQHTYGFFATNDTQTNIILPGNLGSRIRTLNQESKSSALNYRYNVNDDLSFGFLSTYRSADVYHNLVTALESKFRLDESNTFKAQLLSSDTKDDPSIASSTDAFNDTAYKLNYSHESEYWTIELGQQQINKNFRADLGFMPKSDFKESTVSVKRQYYGDENTWWTEASAEIKWDIQHNQQNELIERGYLASSIINGPMLSRFVLSYSNKDKVGLRKTAENNAIDLNTSRFTESIAGLFAEAQPLASLNIALGIDKGKKIDYSNDRLGNYQEIYGYVTWFITNHLKVDLYQSYSEMKADNELTGLHNANVYTENLIDLRFAYQFDVRSYLKLNIVYDDISKNIANNPLSSVSATDKSLSTQLIYSYQINPQTVFYLGYSDSSYQDDDLTQLTRERKTFFSKISYAWQP
jgi:hypothetical protein